MDEDAEARERRFRIEAVANEVRHLGSAVEQEARLQQFSESDQREIKSLLPTEMLRGIENAKDQKKSSILEILSRNPRMES